MTIELRQEKALANIHTRTWKFLLMSWRALWNSSIMVEIMQLMCGLAEENAIPVMINMHDVELAKRFANRILGMSDGRIVYDGPPEGLDEAMLKTIYGGEGWLA